MRAGKPIASTCCRVNGKDDLSFRDIVRLDIACYRTMSLWLEVRLLIATSRAIADQLRTAVKKRLGS